MTGNTTAHAQLQYFDIDRAYIERLVKNRSRALLLVCTNSTMGCLFFGRYLLVTVVDRGTEAAVYIQDADDWNIEYTTKTVKDAEAVFDLLFNEATIYSMSFEASLKLAGFKSI